MAPLESWPGRLVGIRSLRVARGKWRVGMCVVVWKGSHWNAIQRWWEAWAAEESSSHMPGKQGDPREKAQEEGRCSARANAPVPQLCWSPVLKGPTIAKREAVACDALTFNFQQSQNPHFLGHVA